MSSYPAIPPVRQLAIEVTRLLQERRGIARYVRNVVRELAVQQPSLRFTFVVRDEADIAPMATLVAELHPSLRPRSTVATVSALPALSADVVWYPWNFITVPSTRAGMVVTVHDIAPMLRLDHRWWKVVKRIKYRRRYERTVTQAHAVLTDSTFSRQEILRHLPVDPARVTVTLLAADDLAVAGAEDLTPLERAGVQGPFFLSVGAQDARKNLGTLYTAMDQLWASGLRVPLVQCGPSMSRDTATRLGTAPWLRHLGYVSEPQLATLYRHATALVFPSCYEGFGLPVAEAMSAGTPVICAAGSALAEVAGSAALLVPSQDSAGFARAMRRVVGDEALRRELGTRSLAQVERYSWARTARETFRVFEQTATARRAVPGVTPRAVPAPVTIDVAATVSDGTLVAAR